VGWKRHAQSTTGSCGASPKKGAEEIRSFELSWKEIFLNYDELETKSKETKNKKNGSKNIAGTAYDTCHGGSKATSKWR